MAAQALSASSAFVAPAARRVGLKAKQARQQRAFRVNAIYTESARVPSDNRRWKETERVMERTQEIHTSQELSAAFQLAGDKLVMVAVESDEECTISEDYAASTAGTETDLEQCKQLSSSLSRIAREADEVAFLKVEIVGDNDARALAKELGVTTYPTYQYYKRGELLWQHVGAGAGAAQQLAEGVLYYGGQGADGLHVSDYITECTSKSELDDFIQSCAAPQSAPDGFVGDIEVPCDKQLAVVDIGMDKNAPAGCMNIFPAVLSLARNTMGFTRWARIAVDANAECKDIAKHFNVTQVPAFVFLAGGVVVDTYQGSDRIELMNRVLKFQQANGVVLPQRMTPKRMSTAEAKEIARAARERAKAQGRKSGW
uniref:Thioredoxin domain-containing protein n=1 Tax=Mantoniella antarctica TaxID=81844 RepID=A0A7S0S886_9CHLO